MAGRLVRCTCVWEIQGAANGRLVSDPFCPAEGRHSDER